MKEVLDSLSGVSEDTPVPTQVGSVFSLLKMNTVLSSLENQLLRDDGSCFPNIFILGLPRSGTTLLNQLLFYGLDIACTNNIVAKFWKTPCVGFALSQEILGGYKSDAYESTHGRTSMPDAPHEFSYFWHDLFHLDSLTQLNIGNALLRINWDQVRKVFASINHIAQKGVVYKPLELVGYFLEEFSIQLKNSVFVYISRDPRDVAVSLAQARLAKNGSYGQWWGSIPPSYRDLVNLDFAGQIGGQVRLLERMYDESLIQVDEGRVYRTTYLDICRQPQVELGNIFDMAGSIGQIARTDDFEIDDFTPTRPSIAPEIEERLVLALDDFS